MTIVVFTTQNAEQFFQLGGTYETLPAAEMPSSVVDAASLWNWLSGATQAVYHYVAQMILDWINSQGLE